MMCADGRVRREITSFMSFQECAFNVFEKAFWGLKERLVCQPCVKLT